MAEEKNLPKPVESLEVLDQIDDDAITEMMTGSAIQDYVYSFKQGSKTVEGLTLTGINEAANRRGGIQVDSIQYEERDHSWLVVAKATDTITGSSRYGAYEQAKRMGNKEDKDAFTKSIHKAQRNAIKQLLPVTVIKDVINFYLHGQVPEKKNLPKQQSATPQQTAFACAKSLEDTLAGHELTQAELWSYVKRRYSVESRNDMTEMQWSQLSAELQAANNAGDLFAELVKRIKHTIAAEQESEVETPVEAELVEEGE